MGKLQGALKSLSAAELGAVAISAALQRGGVGPDQVGYVIMGQVLTAGAGQLPARQAAVEAGIPMDVPALTINKVCLSGVDAIVLADQLVRTGEYEIVVAGGQESMSRAPHLLPDSRDGFTFGPATLLDHVDYDGLTDVFTDQSMGRLTEGRNDIDAMSRTDQDAFAAASHEKAAAAWRDGVFADEVVPVPVIQRKGDEVLVSEDEGIRADTTVESLAKLRPAFRHGGTITAGSASQLSDGAAAVVVTSSAVAERLGRKPLAEVVTSATVAGPDSTLQDQPANAIAKACARVGISPTDLDLVEINEAFAAVGIASTRRLGLDPKRVNVDGGAIALGHPLGMSGTRIALHLARALHRRGGGIGAAALCGGGGQGEALVLATPGSFQPR